MTENEAMSVLHYLLGCENAVDAGEINEHNCLNSQEKEALQFILEEIQQYREYKEIFKSHFAKEALELLRDKEEFGKWLERGKWIAKKCDEINRKLEGFEAIGTIEEFKTLKEKNEPKEVAYQIDTSGHKHEKCPTCGSFHVFGRHCTECGQSIIEWWNLKERKS